MINKLRFLCTTLLLLAFAGGAWAQHWTAVNPHDYQHDMQVYATLQEGGKAVTDLSQYEVAAFVGGQCRSVAEVISVGSAKVLSLRIYSNVTSGETITIRVWDTAAGEEVENVKTNALSFTKDALEGTPSSPFTIRLNETYILGDVNRDGSVSSGDVVTLVKYILSDKTTDIDTDAADMNGDSNISSADVVALVRYLLTNL